jgi:hypothetical protein
VQEGEHPACLTLPKTPGRIHALEETKSPGEGPRAAPTSDSLRAESL